MMHKYLVKVDSTTEVLVEGDVLRYEPSKTQGPAVLVIGRSFQSDLGKDTDVVAVFNKWEYLVEINE
jgi:hypothetical protein